MCAMLVASAALMLWGGAAAAQEESATAAAEQASKDIINEATPSPSMGAPSNSSGSSHTESSSESSSVSVSVGAPSFMRPKMAPPRSREDRMVGTWRLSSASGDKQCKIDLKAGGGAWSNAGCPDGFFPSSKWKLSGGELQIGDAFHVVGTFHPVGGNRWEGTSASGDGVVILSR